MRLRPGASAIPFEAVTAHGVPVRLADYGDRVLLLSFLRYASCPMCNLRVHELRSAYPTLRGRGVEVAVVFHSPARSILRHAGKQDAPFPLIADPGRRLYALYGVERSWPRLAMSVVLPSFLVAAVKATALGYWGGRVDGDWARMPADFLIGPGGRVLVAHYGAHIGDHLAVSRALEHVGCRAPEDRPVPPDRPASCAWRAAEPPTARRPARGTLDGGSS
jgi:thioredoxin-dependent peroxiredoxin